MKAENLLKEISAKGYTAVIDNIFDYRIDKNRRFNIVRIDYAPNVELISVADSHNCIWVAQTLVEFINNQAQNRVVYYSMSKNMKDFDFDEK